jgi:hypothetical protein
MRERQSEGVKVPAETGSLLEAVVGERRVSATSTARISVVGADSSGISLLTRAGRHCRLSLHVGSRTAALMAP